jgi:[CysO sulfur-carrier protein]-S-L-cysteine hydrolase
MTREQWAELVAHARGEKPNECCGILRMREGTVESLSRADNERASPYGYSLDPQSLLAAFKAAEEGYRVAIYHSHPRSPAEPSQTDINLAEYPDYLYVIVSLAGEPDVRAWWIVDGKVEEERVEVVRSP